MEQMSLTIEMESAKAAYGEYVKGLEMSRAELMDQEAPFIYFDKPILPLEKKANSIIQASMFGMILCGVLLVIFLILRFELSNLLSDS